MKNLQKEMQTNVIVYPAADNDQPPWSDSGDRGLYAHEHIM